MNKQQNSLKIVDLKKKTIIRVELSETHANVTADYVRIVSGMNLSILLPRWHLTHVYIHTDIFNPTMSAAFGRDYSNRQTN